MIGEEILHYRVLEKLGQGGMGVVYLAEDTKLGRKVALKSLTTEYARDPRHRKRFQQEARAAASITHPGIASVYALEEAGGELYIVYEYVKGETLRKLIRRERSDEDTLLDIASDVARALAAAHTKGVVHRDLKPENIIRTPEGETKILDFGLARFAPSPADVATATTQSDTLTIEGSIVGTISYMSPEQLQGQEVDYRSDIFSFGVLLYELATGTRPFEGSSAASTIANIMTAEPMPLTRRNPLSPPELDRIVRKCLRKKREERYQSTQDLAVDLAQLRRESGEGRAPAALAAEVEEPGLVQRAFRVWGLTPRRWWELDTLAGLIVFYPLIIYLAWKVKESVPADSWLFLAPLGPVLASVSLRVFLLATAAFNSAALPREVRRLAPWLMFAHGMVLYSLLLMASMIGAAHTGFATLLVGFALAGAVAVLIVHPAINRATFPEIGTIKTAPPGLTESRRMGWIQAIYLGPFGLLMVLVPVFIEESIGNADKVVLGGMIGFWVVVLAFGIVIGRTTLAMWEGNRQSVSLFYRWFPLFFLADLLAVALMVGVPAGMKMLNVALLLLVLPVLLYLPFYQRQLARKLLGSAGNRK